jgi:AraC family transcriptional activator of pobA
VALISEGSGVLELGGAAADVAPRTVLLTAPGEVRRWRLERPALEGLLVFFEAEMAESLVGAAGEAGSLAVLDVAARTRSFATSRRAFDRLFELAGGMRDELGRLRPDSAHALRADTYRLLVDLQRAAGPEAAAAARPSVAPAASARARALAARFEALVEERFRVDQRLASYAERLGVGTRHLGGVVRQVAGASPAECIRRRQFLEARRLLLQSSLSVGRSPNR